MSDTVPIDIIMPVLTGAQAALQHLADTMEGLTPGQPALAAAYARTEASRIAATIMLLTPSQPPADPPKNGAY